MRVIARKALRLFWEKHPDAERPLRAWFAEVRTALWDSGADIKSRYCAASVLKGGRVVFNIRGNRYRLVARLDYRRRIVFIRFVGTHEEYNRVDAETI